MSETRIKISRRSEIAESIEVAIRALDNHIMHICGQPVMVRYYSDDGSIDVVLAIGISDGFGRDHYRMISLSQAKLVWDVSDTLPDVSDLLNDELYLSYVYGVWNEVTIDTSGTDRSIVSITDAEPKKYLSLADGYYYFGLNGIVRREDDFYTQSEITVLLGSLEIKMNAIITEVAEELTESIDTLNQDLNDFKELEESNNQGLSDRITSNADWLLELDNEVFPLSISMSSSKTQYLLGEIATPTLTVGTVRQELDVTSDCTFTLNGNAISLNSSKQYSVPGFTSNTTFTCTGTYTPRGITALTSVSMNFGYYLWHGLIPETAWDATQSNIFELTKSGTLSSNSSNYTVSGITSAAIQRYAIAFPVAYGPLTSILDGNNFEDIADWTLANTVSLTIDSLGTHSYYVYTKNTGTAWSNIKLTFHY